MSASPEITAFPCTSNTGGFVSRGMTLRDYFAAKAMQGMLANANWNNLALAQVGISERQAITAMAKISVMYSDSLLAELNKEPK